MALLVLLTADGQHHLGVRRRPGALGRARRLAALQVPRTCASAASFDDGDALRPQVQRPDVRFGDTLRDGVEVVARGGPSRRRPPAPPAASTRRRRPARPRRVVRRVDEARHDDGSGAPSSHPAHHVRTEQRAVHDIGRRRPDAATQLADATEVVLTAQGSDVEAVGPDPLLVAEAGVVHRGDRDVVAPISQGGKQCGRRVLGAARAEAVDDEQQLHRPITELPRDLPSDTLDERHVRLPCEQLARRARRHLRCGRHRRPDAGVASTGTAAPTAVADDLDQLAEARAPASCDVDGDARFEVGGRGAHRRLDDIVDEREVAHLLPIAEQREGPAGPGGFDEPVNGHVRALPWSVHREVAQRHRRHTEVRRVGAAQQLRRQLGDAVRVVRLGRVALARRVPAGPAVHRGARREHEPLHWVTANRFEQPLGDVHVELVVQGEAVGPGQL